MCVCVCRCAYVMVCELDENRLLAEMVLTNITRLIREHVTSHEQKNAEASRTEHISNSNSNSVQIQSPLLCVDTAKG